MDRIAATVPELKAVMVDDPEGDADTRRMENAAAEAELAEAHSQAHGIIKPARAAAGRGGRRGGGKGRGASRPETLPTALDVDGALEYLATVKERFASQESVYQQVLLLLQRYRGRALSVHEVRSQIAQVLAGNEDLVNGFQLLLPARARGGAGGSAAQAAAASTAVAEASAAVATSSSSQPDPAEADAKWKVRGRIWDELERRNLVSFPRPCHGRIPNFVGSDAAAHQLAATPEFQRARVIKVHPSLNANAFRERCYAAQKTVLVPPLPGHDYLYICVDGAAIPPQHRAFASTKAGFNKFGTPITSLLDIPDVDFVVVASTAVCASTGARLGKGAGYGEVEWGILAQLGKVSEATPVATLVHDVQLVTEDELPTSIFAHHDLPVDVVATPHQLVRCVRRPTSWQKPTGIDWTLITPQMASDIGALRQLRRLQHLPDLPLPPRQTHLARKPQRHGGQRGRGKGGGRRYAQDLQEPHVPPAQLHDSAAAAPTAAAILGQLQPPPKEERVAQAMEEEQRRRHENVRGSSKKINAQARGGRRGGAGALRLAAAEADSQT